VKNRKKSNSKSKYNFLKKPVNKINRELYGLAQKLLSLWTWEPL
jgi:hypothetical protein